MNIHELLLPQNPLEAPIPEENLIQIWQSSLAKIKFKLNTVDCGRLTDMTLAPIENPEYAQEIPVHFKVISKHMNGSFRCHIGKNCPIQSIELYQKMRLLLIFFKTKQSKVSPEFIFFPSWLLHLFRYTQHESASGRTDIRFLENENIAREDHIYKLNHVLNRLFRFNFHSLDTIRLKSVIDMANFLFETAGLDYRNLPRPTFSSEQPDLYFSFLLLLYIPRPKRIQPMCLNCHHKPSSRRQLCIACYRYQLKHGDSRPLRLIVSSRSQQQNSAIFHHSSTRKHQKLCVNCKVTETHQWYSNLCGNGNWCETCKSYYLRHGKIRPPNLFQRAAKRKINVGNLIDCYTWSWSEIPYETIQYTLHNIYGVNSTAFSSTNTSNTSSGSTTPYYIDI